jgi:hypothetical protein
MIRHTRRSDLATSTLNSAEEQVIPGRPILPRASRRRGLPFHPLLIAAFPILGLYAHNIDEVPLREIWRPLGFALLGTMAVWILFSLLTRHIRKAALAATAVVLVFFSYGHVSSLLPYEMRDATGPLCLAGLSVLLFVLCRSRRRLVDATVVLNLASVALLVPSCLVIGPKLIARPSETTPSAALRGDLVYRRGGMTQTDHRSRPVPTAAAANLPDIYYIILDGYGRSDSLKTFYDFDNTPFLRALEERGFYVARHSRANYAQTGDSLPTSLNMNYLDVLLRERGQTENLFETQRRMIDENAVAACLRQRGYRYVYLWTGNDVTRVDTADLELDSDSLTPPSTFEAQVLGLSALGAAPQPAITGAFAGDYERHRGYILTAFHNLNVVARLPYPKFVFAHISAPHPPFVFGPNGEAVNPRYPYTENDGSLLLGRITRQQYRSGYVAQLRYVNRRVLEAVDAIIRQSHRPPIMILQGDHGSRMNLDWSSQAKTDLREPFSILNAYLVPPRVRRHLYDSITPVNSFRIMLTSLFGANYPPLPDRSFFATPDHPLRFTEVTNLIPRFIAGQP